MAMKIGRFEWDDKTENTSKHAMSKINTKFDSKRLFYGMPVTHE